MSFSADGDPHEMLEAANSISGDAINKTMLTFVLMAQRFGDLGQAMQQFPGIPQEEFSSVVRDDFQPRLLNVGNDSTSLGESVVQVALTLREFQNNLPPVKSAAANLEQVLSQSTSPKDWKEAAAPLASALNAYYSTSVPPVPDDASSVAKVPGGKAGKDATASVPSPADSHGSTLPNPSSVGGSPSAPSSAPNKPNTNKPDSAAQNAASGGAPSSDDQGGSGSGQGGGQGGGSPSSSGAPSSGSGSGATPAAANAKQPANPQYSAAPVGSTDLQSADWTPAATSASGLGGSGGGLGGLGAKSLGSTPGGGAGLSAGSSLTAGGGVAGAARAMSASGMMGGMMPGAGGGRAGDKEHKTPDYLYNEDNGYDLIEKLPVVSPDVIGSLSPEELEEMELESGFAFSEPA